MQIAVIIPVKNEKDSIQVLAEALLKQTLCPDEIIFIDAGSTDGSIRLIEELVAKNTMFKHVQANGAFPGAARNTGILNSQAEIIAQIDGSNLPVDDSWLENLCRPLLDGKAEYVMGSIKIMPIWKIILGTSINIGEIYGASLFGQRNFCDNNSLRGGASVAYLRSIWEKTGGFPEECRFGADSLFAIKVQSLNPLTSLEENAAIYWQIGPRFVDIVERQFRYQMAKFRKPGGILRYRATVLLPTLALILFSMAFFIGFLRWVLLALFAMYWIYRCSLTSRIHRERSSELFHGRKMAVVYGAIAFVEFIHILSKFIGTFFGFAAIKVRKLHNKIIREYLSEPDKNA